ncbi:MAG TPA: hypothetical protein VKK79_21410 [Candidatus Lokiarchaeia archaeon]|nr:hypothetical protein [Candidatus Lokiarchaeia archaeon]
MIDKEESEGDKEEVEFPNDQALQLVHAARETIAKKAKDEGMSYFEYIKTHAVRKKNTQIEV